MGTVTSFAAVFIVFGAFWLWKALLSRATTTGTANQSFQGLSSRNAQGAWSQAATQRAAALPCAALGVALCLPGAVLLLVGPSRGVADVASAIYLVVAQAVGFAWAKRRADRAALAAATAHPDEPGFY